MATGKSGHPLFREASHSRVQSQSIPPEYTSIDGWCVAKQRHLASVAAAFLPVEILFSSCFLDEIYQKASDLLTTAGTYRPFDLPSTANCLRRKNTEEKIVATGAVSSFKVGDIIHSAAPGTQRAFQIAS